MEPVTTPVMYRNRDGFFVSYTRKNARLSLCEGEVEKYFVFPTGTRCIQFVITDKPGADKLPVLLSPVLGLNPPGVTVFGNRKSVLWDTRCYLARITGVCDQDTRLYVECYYWE